MSDLVYGLDYRASYDVRQAWSTGQHQMVYTGKYLIRFSFHYHNRLVVVEDSSGLVTHSLPETAPIPEIFSLAKKWNAGQVPNAGLLFGEYLDLLFGDL